MHDMSAESNRLISADLLLDTLLSRVSMPEKNDVELASRVKAAYRAQDDFALASVWQAEELPEGQDFFPEVFDAMMRPWVGGVGRLDAKPEDIEELRTFPFECRR